jgi:hypothetical protein
MIAKLALVVAFVAAAAAEPAPYGCNGDKYTISAPGIKAQVRARWLLHGENTC